MVVCDRAEAVNADGAKESRGWLSRSTKSPKTCFTERSILHSALSLEGMVKCIIPNTIRFDPKKAPVSCAVGRRRTQPRIGIYPPPLCFVGVLSCALFLG
jgi:hypothetical protein